MKIFKAIGCIIILLLWCTIGLVIAAFIGIDRWTYAFEGIIEEILKSLS